MRIIKVLKKIKRSLASYDPLIEILISKSNLLNNLDAYKRAYPKLAVAPVLKSNAYGHGLVLVAQILDKEGVTFFIVDSLFEAMVLRNEGINTPILIIGYTAGKNICSSRIANTAFAITNLDQLQAISRGLAKPRKFHLKIDTGMHRQGILPSQISEAVKIIKDNRLIILEGVCSHLADADNENPTFTRQQIKLWNKLSAIFRKNFPGIRYYHLAATAGIRYSDEISANVLRLGIGLYGIKTLGSDALSLKPVLQMQSIISSVKKIPAGEFVGYGCSYRTLKNILAATIPVGYFEGIDRRLSNRGFIKVGSEICPIIGKISMNICAIDVTGVLNIKPEDKAVIVSNNPKDLNSIEKIAEQVKSIPYEVLVHIPQHLRRVIVE